MATGCGANVVSDPGTHVDRVTHPPSMATLKHLLPQNHTIIKTTTLKFKGHAPKDVVVTAIPPTTKKGVVGGFQVSTITWNTKVRHWQRSWQSPIFTLQRGVKPGHPEIGAILSWHVHQTSHGALVGVLDPASLGADTIWNDGLILWVPPAKPPRLIWEASGTHMVSDGTLTPTAQGIHRSTRMRQA